LHIDLREKVFALFPCPDQSVVGGHEPDQQNHHHAHHQEEEKDKATHKQCEAIQPKCNKSQGGEGFMLNGLEWASRLDFWKGTGKMKSAGPLADAGIFVEGGP
jgi:hypothetical protein